MVAQDSRDDQPLVAVLGQYRNRNLGDEAIVAAVLERAWPLDGRFGFAATASTSRWAWWRSVEAGLSMQQDPARFGEPAGPSEGIEARDKVFNQPLSHEGRSVRDSAIKRSDAFLGEAPNNSLRKGAGRGRRVDAQPRNGRAEVPLRIALLAPYAAGNLGDGAMQDAVIRNLVRRRPSVLLIGITLAPCRTAPLHRIPAFGITGRYGGWCASDGHDASQTSADVGISDPSDPMLLPRARELLKNLPVVGPVMRRGVNGMRKLWAARHEPAHLVRSFRLARSLDAIIVAGSGQLDEHMRGPWGHPYALFRWAMIARLTRTPLLDLSIGRGDLHTWLGLWFTRHALATAEYRSYRDAGTRDSLGDWGFTRHDPVVPDLAFSDIPRRVIDSESGRRVHVAISPICYGSTQLWKTGTAGTHERYMEALLQLVVHLMDSGHRISLFVSADSDRSVMEALRTRIEVRLGVAAADAIADLPCTTPGILGDALTDVDIVVGSRLHSIILAHRASCLALAISWHRKVDVHMSMMDESDARLGIEIVDGPRLIEVFDRLAGERVQRVERIQAVTCEFDRALQDQYDHVVKVISMGTNTPRS